MNILFWLSFPKKVHLGYFYCHIIESSFVSFCACCCLLSSFLNLKLFSRLIVLLDSSIVGFAVGTAWHFPLQPLFLVHEIFFPKRRLLCEKLSLESSRSISSKAFMEESFCFRHELQLRASKRKLDHSNLYVCSILAKLFLTPRSMSSGFPQHIVSFITTFKFFSFSSS